jgi:hypothetical protein
MSVKNICGIVAFVMAGVAYSLLFLTTTTHETEPKVGARWKYVWWGGFLIYCVLNSVSYLLLPLSTLNEISPWNGVLYSVSLVVLSHLNNKEPLQKPLMSWLDWCGVALLTCASIVSIQWDTHAEEPILLWTTQKAWVVFGLEWALAGSLIGLAWALHQHKQHGTAQRFCLPIAIGLFSAQTTVSISFVLRTFGDPGPWSHQALYVYGVAAMVSMACLCTTYYYARVHPHTDAILVLVLSQAPFFAVSTVNSVLVFEKSANKYRVLVLAFLSFVCLSQHKVQNHIQHRRWGLGQTEAWKPLRSTKTAYWTRSK